MKIAPFFLLFIFLLLTTSEPIIEKLGNTNGIVPFKLGYGNIRSNYHVFAHFIDLNDFYRTTVKTNVAFDLIKNTFNSSDFIIEQRLIQNKISEISIAFKQVNHNKRPKRDLVNLGGFALKFMVGSLDTDDALKYDAASI